MSARDDSPARRTANPANIGRQAQDEASAAERRHMVAREVASALQAAMLPVSLPVLPCAWIAARHLTAPDEKEAGGDWFDAAAMPGGSVALVVGDAVGRGVGALAAMGQLRAVLRHELTTQPSLDAALARLDAFAAVDPELRAATVCAAVLEPVAGALRYCTFGHPAPLIVAPDGATRYLPATGAGPLGTGTAAGSASAILREGDTVLLYSDGMIERPGRTLSQGMTELATVAADAALGRTLYAASGATPAERVCQLTVELLNGNDDDVTALALQRLPGFPPLDMEVRARREAVVTLRHALDGWLGDIGVATADRQVAELAVTEAVANAVEHAYRAGHPGPVRLEAELGADGYLLARVSDRGRWRVPGSVFPDDRGQGLMLAGQLAGELTVSHPPQESGAALGARGTVVTLRHRLCRSPMLSARVAATTATLADEVLLPAEGVAFSVEQVTAGPVPHVRVRGPADIATAERLASRLLAACRGGVLSLTADLSDVTVLASAGVRTLYQVRDRLSAHRQELTLTADPGSPAAEVLALARLDGTAPRSVTRARLRGAAGHAAGPDRVVHEVVPELAEGAGQEA